MNFFLNYEQPLFFITKKLLLMMDNPLIMTGILKILHMTMINGYHQFILCDNESSIQQTLLLSHQMSAE